MLNLSEAPVTVTDQTGQSITIENLEQAQQWLEGLQVEIRDIETQLGERNRTDAEGRRLDGAEYWAWRDRARRALFHKQRTAARLKQFVRAHRQGDAWKEVGRLRHLIESLGRCADCGRPLDGPHCAPAREEVA